MFTCRENNQFLRKCTNPAFSIYINNFIIRYKWTILIFALKLTNPVILNLSYIQCVNFIILNEPFSVHLVIAVFQCTISKNNEFDFGKNKTLKIHKHKYSLKIQNNIFSE